MVYAGERAGPVTISGGSNITTIASLTVPVGTWVAFAKMDAHVEELARDVVCELTSPGEYQRIRTRAGAAFHEAPGVANVSLNVVHTFTDLPGKFRLRCRAEDPGVTARNVRLIAMRVGTLTEHSLELGSSTTTGSTKPEVIHAHTQSAVSVYSDNFRSIATLPLPDGRWWIQAYLSVVETESSGAPIGYECQMTVGGQTDAVDGTLDPGDATMVSFNIAAIITPRTTLDDVRVRCKAEFGGAFEAGQMSITAMKLGTLTRVDLAGGSTTTSGEGKPVAIHGQRLTAPDLDKTYKNVGEFGFGGSFIASAKITAIDGETVQCRLRDGLDSDQSMEEYPDYGRTMAMQIASSDSPRIRRTLSVQCRDPDYASQPAGDVEYVKITALRLGTLTFRSLTP
ncbi:MAG TPA: hypothetical protein VEX62_12175 [Candidatus Limnocylindrales bacterium]|nr:hypothetical protein [Candidatus Limnocylindrales bacterium]